MSPVPCKICANLAHNELYTVKEMQLGFREPFTYQLCGSCGSMQILDAPSNLSKYYSNEDYYSFKREVKKAIKADPIRTIRSSYILQGKHKLLGSLLAMGYKVPDYMTWVKESGVGFDDKILDVGTGNGFLLFNLQKNGFTNLTGIDPFIDEDVQYGAIRVYKKDIFQVSEQYDFIMLNHVFEHMDEPEKVLAQLYQLVKPQRYLLIRTPVMGCYAWQTYKEHWMQLDAPRHLIVHTEKTIKMLAERTGFRVEKIIYDANEYGLIGSEQYSHDIPLNDERSYMVNRDKSIFKEEDIQRFRETARRTNRDGTGDQAAFYLYKP